MDIYSFIRSKDVAGHCRKIGKTWNTVEMAVIIWRSGKSLHEKHAAWQELIDKYPDMPSIPNIHRHEFKSVHAELAKTMDYELRALELFKEPERDAVYVYKVRWYDEQSDIFSSYEKAMEAFREHFTCDEASEVEIRKRFVDDNEEKCSISVSTDYNGNILYVTEYGGQTARENAFPGFESDFYTDWPDLFYIDIPTPFKRGDILTVPGIKIRTNNPVRFNEPYVFVLDFLLENDPAKLARALRGEICDGSDMIGWGFFVSDEGSLYGEHTVSYDRLEYYNGKLEGKNRLLHYVNLFINDKIGLPEMLNVQCRIVAEHDLENRFIIDGHGSYILENLLAENRPLKEIQ